MRLAGGVSQLAFASFLMDTSEVGRCPSGRGAPAAVAPPQKELEEVFAAAGNLMRRTKNDASARPFFRSSPGSVRTPYHPPPHTMVVPDLAQNEPTMWSTLGNVTQGHDQSSL